MEGWPGGVGLGDLVKYQCGILVNGHQSHKLQTPIIGSAALRVAKSSVTSLKRPITINSINISMV